MTYDFHSAKTPLPVYWFVDRMSCDFQIRPKTALLHILPKDYVSCDGGPDTFTHRALPLETCVYLPFLSHGGDQRTKAQPTTLPVISSLVTFLFHKNIIQLLQLRRTYMSMFLCSGRIILQAKYHFMLLWLVQVQCMVALLARFRLLLGTGYGGGPAARKTSLLLMLLFSRHCGKLDP